MGVVKTALEIALERTEKVKSDKSSIDQFEMKRRGKKLANAFLAGEAELADELKKAPAESRESLKQGIFDVLITMIALPSGNDSEKRIERAGKGLQAVIDSKEFPEMYKQLTQVYSQYLQEAANYEQAISRQYAPKLRQKEEELSRRLGREVRIDPFQDPEFAAFYNQNMSALKGNYEAVIEQAKEETRRMFEERG
jgi:phosphoenolpyruvate-protein kinase (PTS system EI component)